jgi:C-terminal processing protease CtpA/Prc
MCIAQEPLIIEAAQINNLKQAEIKIDGSFVKIAQLIGTNTGGDGIGYTPFLFVLPNSKLVIQMTTCMGINPDGTANEETQTTPDVYVDWSQFENAEELLQYILDEAIR